MADDPSGPGPNPRVTDDEILALFADAEDPVLSTAEVADVLPIERRATLDRLEALRNAGYLDRKKVAGRAVVWWLREE